jgi:hypothetical protein
MRAEDILPDHVDQAELAGVLVRKGTVAAFLANARTWCDDAAAPEARAAAARDIADALPGLRAVGLFDVLEIRDERLRDWVAAHAEPAGAGWAAAAPCGMIHP